MWETWVPSLGQEDPREKETATHPSILAWRTPWTEDLWAAIHRVTKSWTSLSDFHFFFFLQCISTNVWIFQFSFHYWNLILSYCKSEKILCIKSVFSKSKETICGLTNGLSWILPCTLRKNVYFLIVGLGRVGLSVPWNLDLMGLCC